MKGSENEFTRLFDGFGDIQGRSVCQWVKWDTIPKDQIVTYARYTAVYRLEKKGELYRVRITAGGDRLISVKRMLAHKMQGWKHSKQS